MFWSVLEQPFCEHPIKSIILEIESKNFEKKRRNFCQIPRLFHCEASRNPVWQGLEWNSWTQNNLPWNYHYNKQVLLNFDLLHNKFETDGKYFFFCHPCIFLPTNLHKCFSTEIVSKCIPNVFINFFYEIWKPGITHIVSYYSEK